MLDEKGIQASIKINITSLVDNDLKFEQCLDLILLFKSVEKVDAVAIEHKAFLKLSYYRYDV